MRKENAAREYHVAIYSKCLFGIWSNESWWALSRFDWSVLMLELSSSASDGAVITWRKWTLRFDGMFRASLRTDQSFQSILFGVFWREKRGLRSSLSKITVTLSLILAVKLC